MTIFLGAKNWWRFAIVVAAQEKFKKKLRKNEVVVICSEKNDIPTLFFFFCLAGPLGQINTLGVRIKILKIKQNK